MTEVTKFAVNSMGQQTKLPARPELQDYPDQEEWEEAVAGWNHSVAPLLGLAGRGRLSEQKPAPPSND